jgi:hypothetical protein
MISRSVALGLLAAGCVTAAAGGAYLAVRENAAQPAAPAITAPAATQAQAAQQAVSETEAVVTPSSPTASAAGDEPAPESAPAPASDVERPRPQRRESARNVRTTPRQEPVEVPNRPRAATGTPPPATAAVEPPPPASEPLPPSQSSAPVQPAPEPQRVVEPAAPPAAEFEQVTVPAAAVIGLQIENPISSERAQLEDRVTARVTRDVMAGGRVAVPAGSRVVGSVTLVEKGGKVKERARLGVRFHTLVLADGTELALRTEQVLREGESPAGDSSRKIGGAAVGGAILGAILGGGKGAVIGGATGAAGGTAVVMAGDRHAATLPAGAIVTVRLTSPVDLQIEKH